MKQYTRTLIAAFVAALVATTAAADCQVEYKAKKDKPLRLEHGTLVVAGTCEDAEEKVEKDLAKRGWTLLKVLSLSDV